VLSEQAVGVVVGTALPRALWVAEVNIDVGRQAKPSMIGQLLTATGYNFRLILRRLRVLLRPIIAVVIRALELRSALNLAC
jgi:hypothetical protein